MSINVFTSILFFCSLATIFLTAKALYENSKVQFLQNANRREKIILIISIVALIATQFKSCSESKINKKKEQAFSDTLTIREKRYRQHIDSLSQNFAKLIGSSKDSTIVALAKYGLKYDTAQQRIEKLIKDSSQKKITNIISSTDPSIGLDKPAITVDSSIGNNELMVSINIKNFKGSAYNVKAAAIGIHEINDRFIIVPSSIPFSFENVKLEENEDMPLVAKIRFRGTPKGYLYFFITGSYTNADKSKTFNIEQIRVIDFEEKNQGTPYTKKNQLLRQFLKSKNLLK